MSSFQIKILAIFLMIVDHIGLFFFPNLIIFRVIGRLSFPLFAFLIANGAIYTKNINSYLKRLFIFALISQIPFYFANNAIGQEWYLNVLFTLFLGLFAIKIIKETKDKRIWLLAVLLMCFFAIVFKTDYQAEGVLSIVLFYLFFNNLRFMALSQILLLFLSPTIVLIFNSYSSPKSIPILPVYFSALGLFSLIFISFYNKKEGKKAKYLFYVFYPLQYVVFLMLKFFF
jgi:hypothetical protein